jgi:hypothetical protein
MAPRSKNLRPSAGTTVACARAFAVMAFAIFFAFPFHQAEPARAGSNRTTLFPQLRAGQKLSYLIRTRSKKNVRTESHVVNPSGPQDSQADAQWIVNVEILDVQPQSTHAVIHARSQLLDVNVSKAPKDAAPSTAESPANSSEKFVEFTILPSGRIDSIRNIDSMFPEQRDAWQQWLRQFAIAAAFPRDGVKRGQSWKSTEPEQAPSPIDRLEWQKNVTYVRDEPCAPVQLTDFGEAQPAKSESDTCAVVLTQATLKQKSPLKDTTPGDYKLRDLHTSGSAAGSNETISYISLRTGLVTRVTENAKQSMDVIIAKADNSNQIRYTITAASHTELLLLASPGARP